ncbi:phytanoyl-CoA dioxygenase family protein [Sphingomonas sp. ID0503]|uniref:phytanoyl-CoA dioxygenase family protein n=1 Tax=Sphingomonas sp. ID0503 TaxID=3399691 RepID=UPI003AFADE45
MSGLAAEALERYRADGVLFPLPAIAGDEIAALNALLARHGAARDGSLPAIFNLKAHLLFPDLWNLVHDSRIVDPVASLLGPDVLCWAASFFDKPAGSVANVAWHQDATYWGLARPDALTAWIAFTPSTPENGCMRVVRGSHVSQRRHVDAGDPENMLPGGERIAATVDEATAVDVVLQPGEMSIHHLLTVHGSAPNRSVNRRCGFAIRYVAAATPQARGHRASATLVRGRDHGTFGLEEMPLSDLDPAALRRYGAIVRESARMVRQEIGRHREEIWQGEP